MTDNEIKKALECCKIGECNNCPFYGVKGYCDVELPKEALDLINRKDDMINGLIAGQETLQKALAKRNEEIEDLRVEIDFLNNDLLR